MPHLRTITWSCALGLMLARPTPSKSDDWPQWQGPHRTGHSAETDLQSSWPEGGPRRSWLYENCGTGYSGPAIVGNRLYIMGSRGGMTHLFAIDVRQGKQVWATPIAPEFNESQGNGPRGTPAVAGDHVFGLTCTGTLICANGRLYLLGEHDAMVRLAEVSEEGWAIHGQFQLEPQSDHQKAGRVWTHPVIADGKLYLRDQEYLFCYDVREH